MLALSSPAVAPAQQPVEPLRSAGHDSAPGLITLRHGKYSGWQLAGPHCVVVSNRTPDDLEPALSAFTETWESSVSLSRQWTAEREVSRLRTALVFIDGSDALGPEAAASSLQVSGAASVLVLRQPGATPLDHASLYDLRVNAVRAYLRATDMDVRIPAWVQDGLAEHIAGQHSPVAAPLSIDSARVRFWLTGHDGRFAVQLVESMREAVEQPGRWARLEELERGSRQEFQAWQADPAAGTVRIEPDPADTAPVQQLKRELAAVLKLVAHTRLIPSTPISPKVVEFGKELPAESGGASQVVPMTWAFDRLTESGRPGWSSLDAAGEPVFSTDAAAVRRVLGLDENRFRLEWAGGRWRVRGMAGDGRTLAAWLETAGGRTTARFRVDR